MRTRTYPSLLILSLMIVWIGGSWIFDRSGPIENIVDNHSGSLIDQYQILPDDAPWIAESDLPRSYMQSGVLLSEPRIIHTQQSLISDLLWIRNIQHVGKYVLRADTPGLFGMIDNLTTLSPAWAYPYAFVQYIGPQQPPAGGEPGDIEKLTRQQTIDVGEDGIRMTCDADRIGAILSLSDADFVRIVAEQGEAYDLLAHPCSEYTLPHTLAFNYFYYMKDYDKASNYYKIAAMHPDAPLVTATMPALLKSRSGSHLISAQLWFDRAMALEGSMSDDPSIQAQYDRALAKAIYELQLHILVQSDAGENACLHDFGCLREAGAIRKTIQTIAGSCTTNATITEQIQCILLQQAMETGYITPSGSLINPTADSLDAQREYDDQRGGWRTR